MNGHPQITRLRDVKRRARAGVAITAIATVLSACAATAPEDESLVATRIAGPPLPLLRPAVAAGVAGAPLQLVQRVRPDWVGEAAAPMVAEPGRSDGASQDEGPTGPPAVPPSLPAATALLSAEGPEQSSTGQADGSVGSQHDVTVAERPVGMPLQLLDHDRPDWLVELDYGPIVAEGAVAEPSQVLSNRNPDWLFARHAEPIVDERVAGEPLQLVSRDRPDWLDGWHDAPVVAQAPTDQLIPLVLGDGSYHWPEPAALAALDEEPCQTTGGAGAGSSGCSAAGDQIALADIVVGDDALSEMRGGFITAGGFQIDFGYYIETLVDGVAELTSALTLDDMMAGNTTGVPVVGSVSLSGAGGTSTTIQHNLSAAEISATIENSQSDLDISTIATLAIDVIDLRQVQIGNASGAVGQIPMELQQSIIRGLR